MKDQHDNKTIDWVGVPRNSYAKNFEMSLDILLFAVFSSQAITWVDIQENVAEKARWTLSRHLNALVSLGYLERSKRNSNNNWTYVATEKSKQLFGAVA